MESLAPKIQTITECLSQRFPVRPQVGLVLGTGLGNLAELIKGHEAMSYGDVPHLPASTALGHAGQFVSGRLSGVDVLAMQGRFHLYEGYDAATVALPIRVMQQLGVRLLIVSNASGGLNPQYASGDIMIIDDHINLMWQNPLVGPHEEHWGPRFPDMSRPYDSELSQVASATAHREGFHCHRGVYAALSGPTYETRAEYRMLRRLGADVVGMSTIPEVLVAGQIGLRSLGLSVVTNVCRPDTLDTTDGHQVQAAAERAEANMSRLVLAVLKYWQEHYATVSETP